MLFQITNICLVRLGVIHLICETSQWNTYDHKHYEETNHRNQQQNETRTHQTGPRWSQTHTLVFRRRQSETYWRGSLLTLLLLNTTSPVLANSIDPDQLASKEANWSGSALFSIKCMNLYQQSDQVNWLKLRNGRGILIHSAWQGLIWGQRQMKANISCILSH